MSIGNFLAALATICFSSSVKSHKIWGPGLTPALNILPVQYFFVQLEGGDQNNATDQYEELDTGQGRVKEFRVQAQYFTIHNKTFLDGNQLLS